MKYCMLGAAALLGGCTSIPSGSGHRILPSEIQLQVRCELEQALGNVASDKPELNNWGGDYVITLLTERRADAGADALDWVIPWNDNDLLLGFGLSRTERKTEVTVISDSFSPTAEPSLYCEGVDNKPHSFGGKLGIETWLRDSIGSRGHLPSQLGRTVEFDVNIDGSIKPAIGATNISAHLGVGGGHEAKDTLVVTFHEIQESLPQRVIIVGSEPAGKRKAGGKRSAPSDYLEFMILNTQNALRDK